MLCATNVSKTGRCNDADTMLCHAWVWRFDVDTDSFFLAYMWLLRVATWKFIRLVLGLYQIIKTRCMTSSDRFLPSDIIPLILYLYLVLHKSKPCLHACARFDWLLSDQLLNWISVLCPSYYLWMTTGNQSRILFLSRLTFSHFKVVRPQDLPVSLYAYDIKFWQLCAWLSLDLLIFAFPSVIVV